MTVYNVFEIHLPANKQKEMCKKAKAFHYEGKTQVFKKMSKGITLFLPCLAAEILVPVLTLGDGNLNGNAISKATTPLRQAISRYGYHFQEKIPIPHTWVKGTLKDEDSYITYPNSIFPTKLDYTLIDNPNYIQTPTNNRTIYIVDWNTPSQIWSKGINMNADVDSHFIFFTNMKDAFRFAKLINERNEVHSDIPQHISTFGPKVR